MDHGIFMRCEICKRDIPSRAEKISKLDLEGYSHTFCKSCFANTEAVNAVINGKK